MLLSVQPKAVLILSGIRFFLMRSQKKKKNPIVNPNETEMKLSWGIAVPQKTILSMQIELKEFFLFKTSFISEPCAEVINDLFSTVNSVGKFVAGLPY